MFEDSAYIEVGKPVFKNTCHPFPHKIFLFSWWAQMPEHSSITYISSSTAALDSGSTMLFSLMLLSLNSSSNCSSSPKSKPLSKSLFSSSLQIAFLFWLFPLSFSLPSCVFFLLFLAQFLSSLILLCLSHQEAFSV